MRPFCKVGSLLLIPAFWLLSGCSSAPRRETVLGEAYIGPATLKLRRELTSRTADGPALKHGERVEIVGRRRTFVKVRGAQGVVGWALMSQLLSTEQMEALNRLAQRAAELPSHGAASVYEPLNVRTEPNRQAPTFHQIREGERVEVIEQRLAPRVPFRNPRLLPAPPETTKQAQKPKEPAEPPPPPVPPSTEPALPKPLPADTWALVRLANGRAGWVVARMVRMDIPDEVAQYSEGHRITSYFSMGQVSDRGAVKHNWLWTTIAPGNHEHDFDSFRYFVWSLRHHRYETAYIERNLKGYFPVTLEQVPVTARGKTQTMPGFSLIVEEADGARYRRTYVYQVYLVRLVSKARLGS
ncbi:MAG: hypothetical protein AAB225_23325 [Acidobacteriota bacterium]